MMQIFKYYKTVLAIVIFVALSAQAAMSANDSALQIANKSEDAINMAKDSKSEMVMGIFDKNGSKRERRLISYAKNYPDDSRKALLVFDYPADIRGTSFLVWSLKNKDNQQWLYLPALGRIRQISTSDQDGSFMGSDFSYYDMGVKNTDDFNYKLIKEEVSGNAPCYVIESVPKKSSVYGKIVSWIRKDNYIPVRLDIYDQSGVFLKQCLSSQIQTISGIPTPIHIEMRQAQGGKYTTIDFKNIKYNSGVTDDIFTQRYMQKGK